MCSSDLFKLINLPKRTSYDCKLIKPNCCPQMSNPETPLIPLHLQQINKLYCFHPNFQFFTTLSLFFSHTSIIHLSVSMLYLPMNILNTIHPIIHNKSFWFGIDCSPQNYNYDFEKTWIVFFIEF